MQVVAETQTPPLTVIPGRQAGMQDELSFTNPVEQDETQTPN